MRNRQSFTPFEENSHDGEASIWITANRAFYQAYTGELDVGCLQVIDGRLMQTPFKSGGMCMRTWEYVFVLLTLG